MRSSQSRHSRCSNWSLGVWYRWKGAETEVGVLIEGELGRRDCQIQGEVCGM